MNLRTAIAAAGLLLAAGLAPAAHAGVIVFNQGFETNTAGWFDQSNGWAGTATRVPSGTGGVTSFAGGFHGEFTQTNTAAAGGTTGPFTRFDGYRTTWPGNFAARSTIYLDTSWGAGQGFDYSVAANGTDGNHRRDFIFHVTQDTSTGLLLVGGSNNTNFDPQENLENGNHFEVTQSGWYTFEHLFRDDNGVLAVDLNLYDANGNLLFTETREDPSDLIGINVGGNRYGWFTNIDVNGGIAVDDTQLILLDVPEPLSLSLFGIAALAACGYGYSLRKRPA
jgi:hypothetical protein